MHTPSLQSAYKNGQTCQDVICARLMTSVFNLVVCQSQKISFCLLIELSGKFLLILLNVTREHEIGSKTQINVVGIILNSSAHLPYK